MKKKLVSIIITAHNQEEFLEDCLNSFYNQKTTHPYELILIDDNSKDNTEKLIKEKYPEVGYFKVNYNNACQTRNYGLSKANGDYVGWFDGDDYPADNYIEGLANELDRNKKINFAYPKIYYPNCTIEDNFITACYSWEFSESLHKIRGCLGTIGLLRKEFARKLKWDEEIGKKRIHWDWDYFLTAIEKGLKGRLTHNALFYYRPNYKSTWANLKGG
ncbi:MAG: glycosyltransferase family 2 protein, partial [Caldisericia bacterium]|nr:glycosyltransferase family 2 protein [Caldisericia bacterium]